MLQGRQRKILEKKMAEVNSEELALKARNTLGTMLDYLGLTSAFKSAFKPR